MIWEGTGAWLQPLGCCLCLLNMQYSSLMVGSKIDLAKLYCTNAAGPWENSPLCSTDVFKFSNIVTSKFVCGIFPTSLE